MQTLHPRSLIAVVAAVALAWPGPAPLSAQGGAPSASPFAGSGGGLVVDAAWLQANLDAPGVVVLHAGGGYDEGHIPGSRPVPFDGISVSRGQQGDADWVRLDLPDDLSGVRRTFEALGVSDDSRVVVAFGGTNVPAATRVLWTLEVMGLGARAALLDGGVSAWQAAGGDVETGAPPTVAEGRITTPVRLDRRVERAEVEALASGASADAGAGGAGGARRGASVLLDARRPSSWDGSREEQPGRAGHVPGARSLHAMHLFDDAGRLLPEGELRDLFAEAGVGPDDTVVAYCHIGLWASAVVFAARSLGIDARLYDGSMTEWAADPELPLVRPGSGGGNRPDR